MPIDRTKQDQLIRLKANMVTKSVYHLGKSIGHGIKASQYKEVFRNNEAESGRVISETIQHATNIYKHHREYAAVGRSLLELNRTVIVGALALGTATAGPLGTAGVLAMAGATIGVNALLDYTLEKFDEASQATANAALGRHLHSLQEEYKVDLEEIGRRYTESAPGSTARSEALNELFNPKKGVFNDTQFKFIDAESTAYMQHHMMSMLESKVSAGVSMVAIAQQSAAADRTEIKRQIDQLASNGKVVAALAARNATDIRALRDNLLVLQHDVAEVTKRTGVLESDVTFINQYLFSTMPPGAQLVYLQSQQHTGLSPENKSRLLRNIEAVKRKQDFIDSASKFVNAAGQVAGILDTLQDKLNIDPDLVKHVHRGVQIGNAAVSAFANFTTGNFIGGVSAILGGLFGGGDPAAARHAEIMRHLNAILDNQKLMLSELDAIKGMLRDVIRAQHETLKIMLDIAQDNRALHVENMRRLRITQFLISSGNNWGKDAAWTEIDKLVSFRETLKDAQYHFMDGEFIGFDEMRSHFNQRLHSEFFHDGWKDLYSRLVQPGIDVIFVARQYVEASLESAVLDPNSGYFRRQNPKTVEDGKLQEAELQVWTTAGEPSEVAIGYWNIMMRNAAMLLWRESNPDAAFQDRAAALLQASYPAVQLRAVNERWENRKHRFSDSDMKDESHMWEWINRNLDEPLDVTSVIKVARLIIDLHAYGDLTAPGDLTMLDSETLLNRSKWPPHYDPGRTTVTMLRRCLWLVNLAIIQESIFCGEGILPVITHALAHPENKKTFRLAFNLIYLNKILRTNWIQYAVAGALRTKRIPTRIYQDELMSHLGLYSLENWLNEINVASDPLKTTLVDKRRSPWKVTFTYEGEIELPDGRRMPFAKASPYSRAISRIPMEQSIDEVMSHFKVVLSLEDSVNLGITLPPGPAVDDRTGCNTMSVTVGELQSIRDSLVDAIADYHLVAAEKGKDDFESAAATIANSVLLRESTVPAPNLVISTTDYGISSDENGLVRGRTREE